MHILYRKRTEKGENVAEDLYKGISDVRVELNELVDGLLAGRYRSVTVMRRNQPVGVLLPFGEQERAQEGK